MAVCVLVSILEKCRTKRTLRSLTLRHPRHSVTELTLSISSKIAGEGTYASSAGSIGEEVSESRRGDSVGSLLLQLLSWSESVATREPWS